RRLAGVGVADERHAARAASARAPHLAFLLGARELCPKLGDSVANAPTIELERCFAGATPHAPLLAARSLPQPRCGVGEARDFDLEARFATARVAVKDLDDHAGSVESGDAGRPFEIPELTRCDLVVHGHQRDLGLFAAFFGGDRFGGLAFRLVVTPSFLARRGPAPGPGGKLRELAELAFAEDGARSEGLARLRDARDDGVPERRHEPLELGEARFELAVLDLRQLHRHEDGLRTL